MQPQTAPPAGCQFWWSFGEQAALPRCSRELQQDPPPATTHTHIHNVAHVHHHEDTQKHTRHPTTPHLPLLPFAPAAEFDRRFLTFEVPAHVAKQQRERFLAARKGKKAPVVSLSWAPLEGPSPPLLYAVELAGWPRPAVGGPPVPAPPGPPAPRRPEQFNTLPAPNPKPACSTSSLSLPNNRRPNNLRPCSSIVCVSAGASGHGPVCGGRRPGLPGPHQPAGGWAARPGRVRPALHAALHAARCARCVARRTARRAARRTARCVARRALCALCAMHAASCMLRCLPCAAVRLRALAGAKASSAPVPALTTYLLPACLPDAGCRPAPTGLATMRRTWHVPSKPTTSTVTCTTLCRAALCPAPPHVLGSSLRKHPPTPPRLAVLVLPGDHRSLTQTLPPIIPPFFPPSFPPRSSSLAPTSTWSCSRPHTSCTRSSRWPAPASSRRHALACRHCPVHTALSLDISSAPLAAGMLAAHAPLACRILSSLQPWNGRDPYKHCDDDKLLAWPRSVFGEVV